MKAKIELVEGMRIRLIKGMNNGELPYMGWIDGNVPVGTLGTIHKRPTNPTYPNFISWEVKWDGITPNNDGYFGIGVRDNLLESEYYEVLGIEPDPVCKCGKTSEGVCPRCGEQM